MSEASQQLIEHFRRMIGDEGVSLELLSEDGETLRVRYDRSGATCDACVMEAEDLRMLMEEMIERRKMSAKRVEVVTA
jgi:hypothetical protein